MSTLLGIDSPMVFFLVDSTDGLVQTVEPDPGGGGGGGSFAEVPQFIALCPAFHTMDTPGATFDGRWLGSLTETFDTAFGEAHAHEDGQAFVALFRNGGFLGPVNG